MILGNKLLYSGRDTKQWWELPEQTCVAAYQAKGAATVESSYINLANPGVNDAVPTVAPTWDVSGWTFDGATQYLSTGIVPATGWSMVARFSNASGLQAFIVGSSTGNAERFFLLPRNGPNRTYGYSGVVNIGSGELTTGVMGIAANNCYLNGVLDAVTTGTVITTAAITIGGRNSSGTVTGFAAAKIQDVVIYSTTLTAHDMATLNARIREH